MSSIKYRNIEEFAAADEFENLDILWLSAYSLTNQRTGWQGTMHAALANNNHPGKSEVVFLPMIDLSSSDENCLYSTLLFIASQASYYGYTPILTFDQPLWWKSMLIVENDEQRSPIRKIILRLGGFHTIMNFSGCIEHLMDGSGLQELLSLVYAENAVPHMLSGKAISRAVRGHLLIDSAINALVHDGNIFQNVNNEVGC